MNSHLGSVSDWASQGQNARYHACELAQLCRISPRQLERFFHEKFRQTPQHWLDELRLKNAAGLLLEGAHVKEVAYELYFTDPSHFIRRFKRKYGCTPLQFAIMGGGYEDRPPDSFDPVSSRKQPRKAQKTQEQVTGNKWCHPKVTGGLFGGSLRKCGLRLFWEEYEYS